MKTLLLMSILALTSCQTIRHAEINGEKIHEVTCNGSSRTQLDCMEEASKFCGKQSLKMVPLGNDGSSSIVPMGNSFASATYRSMTFKCE